MATLFKYMYAHKSIYIHVFNFVQHRWSPVSYTYAFIILHLHAYTCMHGFRRESASKNTNPHTFAYGTNYFQTTFNLKLEVETCLALVSLGVWLLSDLFWMQKCNLQLQSAIIFPMYSIQKLFIEH